METIARNTRNRQELRRQQKQLQKVEKLLIIGASVVQGIPIEINCRKIYLDEMEQNGILDFKINNIVNVQLQSVINERIRIMKQSDKEKKMINKLKETNDLTVLVEELINRHFPIEIKSVEITPGGIRYFSKLTTFKGMNSNEYFHMAMEFENYLITKFNLMGLRGREVHFIKNIDDFDHIEIFQN